MINEKITLADIEKAERMELKLEIRARKELLKRLEYPQKLLKAAAEKEQQKKKERIENLTQYKSYREAQDAYGWDIITEEEFDEIVNILEKGTEAIENEISPIEAAKIILDKFIGGLMYEIAGFEFELLPEKEKERVRLHNDEIMAKRKARDEARKAAE